MNRLLIAAALRPYFWQYHLWFTIWVTIKSPA